MLFSDTAGQFPVQGVLTTVCNLYRGADKSLARPTSRSIFFLVRIFRLMLVYMYGTNIPPIMIINRIYENQNLLSL